jgi:hypothetical protein
MLRSRGEDRDDGARDRPRLGADDDAAHRCRIACLWSSSTGKCSVSSRAKIWIVRRSGRRSARRADPSVCLPAASDLEREAARWNRRRSLDRLCCRATRHSSAASSASSTVAASRSSAARDRSRASCCRPPPSHRRSSASQDLRFDLSTTRFFDALSCVVVDDLRSNRNRNRTVRNARASRKPTRLANAQRVCRDVARCVVENQVKHSLKKSIQRDLFRAIRDRLIAAVARSCSSWRPLINGHVRDGRFLTWRHRLIDRHLREIGSAFRDDTVGAASSLVHSAGV